MGTTVEQLAAATGRSVEDVMEACRQAGTLAWGGSTPLDDTEAAAVAARLGPGGPPPPPPPGPWAAGGPPPPPPSGAPPPPWNPAAAAFPMAAPTRSRGGFGKMGRYLASGLVFLAFAGIRVGARIWSENDDRGNAPSVFDADPLAENTGIDPIDLLAVGDCFQDESGSSGAETVDAAVDEVACALPHDAEVYLVSALPDALDAPYPGDDAAFDLAAQQCYEAFPAFVGLDYESSILDFVVLYPSARSWTLDDDRLVVCAVVTMDGTQLTATARGSGR